MTSLANKYASQFCVLHQAALAEARNSLCLALARFADRYWEYIPISVIGAIKRGEIEQIFPGLKIEVIPNDGLWAATELFHGCKFFGDATTEKLVINPVVRKWSLKWAIDHAQNVNHHFENQHIH